MKNQIMLTLAVFLCTIASAQTTLTKTYPVKAGQKLSLKFQYPGVKVSTWNKNEVSVTARVTINGGEHDDAYQLLDAVTAETLTISDKIKDMDKLPRRYTIVQGKVKTTFKNKEDMEDFRKKSTTAVQSYSEGVDMDIKLEIMVPANMMANIKSTYGMVELVDYNGPVNVDATYGGIDASLNKATTGQLTATTNYGKIFSNMDLVLTDKQHEAFLNSITAQPGKGPAYSFTSTYGKIYLRKK